MSKLKLTDGGWELIKSNGDVVDSGGYPLTEDADFVESAAVKLDEPRYYVKPYNVVDERSKSE